MTKLLKGFSLESNKTLNRYDLRDSSSEHSNGKIIKLLVKIPKKFHSHEEQKEEKKKHWETSVIFAITDAQTKADLQKWNGE